MGTKLSKIYERGSYIVTEHNAGMGTNRLIKWVVMFKRSGKYVHLKVNRAIKVFDSPQHAINYIDLVIFKGSPKNTL